MFVQLLSGCFVAVAEDFHLVLSGSQGSFQGSSCFLLFVVLPAVFAVVRFIGHLEKLVKHVIESGISSHPTFVDVQDVNLGTGVTFCVQEIRMTEHADEFCAERSFQRPQRELNRLALFPTARNDEKNVVAVAFEDNTPRPLLVFRIRRIAEDRIDLFVNERRFVEIRSEHDHVRVEPVDQDTALFDDEVFRDVHRCMISRFSIELVDPFAEIAFTTADVEHVSETIMAVSTGFFELPNPADHIAGGRIKFKILSGLFEVGNQLVHLLCHELILCLKTPERGQVLPPVEFV